MCGHSGGGEILGEGFETSKLSWGGGSKLCLGFCFILNIYLTISFSSFFWSRASKHSDTVFFVITHFLSDIPNI